MSSNIRALLAALTLSAALPALAQAPPAQTGPGDSSLTGIVSTDGAPGSCPYCDLRNLDLSGRDFTNANLLGANLSGANLSNAILDGVMLAGANLSNATLDNARLDTTPEGDADLSRANLTNASLQGARMNGTNLQYAELAGTDLTNADLTVARLGPRPRFGTSGGRATIFSKTRISGGVDFGGPTPPGVIVVAEERTAGAAAGPAQWTCGPADLSGLQTVIYVATTGTDSATCGGSPGAACKTIQQGITNCTGPACGVLVGWGEYPVTATVALATGIHVYGGCLPPEQANPAYFSVILAPPGGQPAVAAYNLSSTPTVLQNFQIGGSAAGGNGQASIAMTVAFSNGLSMLDLEVLANEGSPGTAGSSGSPGNDGGDGDGATAGKNGNCDTSGGEGAVKMEVSVDGTLSFTCRPSCSDRNCYGYPGSPASIDIGAPGGTGGQPGDGNCANCPDKPGTAGMRGDDGRDGRCGPRGTRSANVIGTFTGLSWSPSSGNDGGSGGAGGGGGGGGAGGYKAGVCFTDTSEKPGNRGGGGGAGGCGAGRGRGGQQGGGSFALLAQGTSLHFTRSRLVGGRGGNGGAGGPGGTGGAGGSGAKGLTTHGGGDGGRGGNGGAGGGGGGGAGGNSGPSVVVAMIGNVTFAGNPVYYAGATGTRGRGGAGGASGDKKVCTAPNGEDGSLGAVATTQQY